MSATRRIARHPTWPMRRTLLLAPRSDTRVARDRRRGAPSGPAGLARRRRRRPAARPVASPATPSGTTSRAAARSPSARRSTGARSSPPVPPTPTSRRPTRSCWPRRARGLGVLPVVQGTPDWAALNPGDPASPPRDPADFARVLTMLVTRYGPNGSLWAEHPEVAKQPIRAWQIWNEPNLTRYWNVAPWAPSYVKLLKAADKALKAADRGLEDDPRRAAERELEGDGGDLRRRRARLVRRRRRCTRTRASPRT